MRKEPQEPQKFAMKDSFNLLYLLASGHALCITPFIRSGFGVRAFGLSVVVACFMILIYGSIAPAPEMFNYFLAWLAAMLIQRMQSIKADWQGQVIHSRYDGWPSLAMRVPFVKRERTAKLLIEPLVCLAAGLCIRPLSEAIGNFICAGFFSLLFTTGVHHQVQRARVRRLRDAQIEQGQLMQQFNGVSDDF